MSGLGDVLDRAIAGPGVVRVEHEGRVAEVEVVDADRLGVRVLRVRIEGSGLAGPQAVNDAAARLPEALRGLSERMIAVEVAPALGGAVLRSAPGEVQNREFFEARTDGHVTELGRVRVGSAGRESVPFTVTREALGRIVDRVGGE